MKNRLCDLNDHLFAQMERLSDEDLSPEQVQQECVRAQAMVGVADQIIRNAAMQMQAAKMVTDFDGSDPRPYLSMMKDVTSPPVGRGLSVVGRK
jgi:hypothetical protein